MDYNSNRYARQIILKEIGLEGQRRICNASILIVGLGGLGAPVATYLTGAGAGIIGLCDSDIVSDTNLHRQILYTDSQVGMRKVDAARQRLSAQSPSTTFILYPEGLNPNNADNIISNFDIIIDCTDNFSTRYLIEETCIRFSKTWIYGSVGEFKGQIAVFTPETETRYTDLFPDRENLIKKEKATNGVIGPVPGVIGSLQASEAIKLIVGIETSLSGKLFTIDLLSLQTNLIEL